MGIGYIDSIIVYNRILEESQMKKEVFYGTRIDRVRVELNQSVDTDNVGNKITDSCVVKIPIKEAADYISPSQWKRVADKEKYFTFNKENKDFFVIIHKKSIKVDIELPMGKVESTKYQGGFFQHICNEYGYAYPIKSVRTFDLIPRFEIGGY